MAKNIYMVDPFEVLTGNLGSKQDLRYREHDNKAYEAPDGIARAKNYRTRYVGVRRADGSVYFMVKKKSTSNLNNKSRMAMAILGSIAAIKSAIKVSHATDWANLNSIYNYRMAHGGDDAGSAISFAKWLDYWLRQMLQYKQAQLQLTAGGMSVTIVNPFGDETAATALAINTAIFAKFGVVLSVSSVDKFTADGRSFFMVAGKAWDDVKAATNPNYTALFADFTIGVGNVVYNGQTLYTSAGVAVEVSDDIVPNEKYTTIAPSA